MSAVLGVLSAGFLVWVLRLRKANRILQIQAEELDKQLQEAVRRLAQSQIRQGSRTFSKVVDLLAAAGVSGLVLLAAMAVSGFTGAAAITVALASLGGPAGMLGGIGVLLSLGIVISKFGVSDLSAAVVRKILENGSKARIIQEIDMLPRVIPQKFRMKAKSMLTEHAP